MSPASRQGIAITRSATRSRRLATAPDGSTCDNCGKIIGEDDFLSIAIDHTENKLGGAWG
jgi:hypothetical protein